MHTLQQTPSPPPCPRGFGPRGPGQPCAQPRLVPRVSSSALSSAEETEEDNAVLQNLLATQKR